VKSKAVPEYLVVAVAGEFEPGLAIGIRFKLKGDQSLFFIVFMYAKPLIFTREQLLKKFDRVEALASPASLNLRQAFKGKIEVEILTETEIQTAIEDYHSCSKACQLPHNHLQNLQRALEINRKSDCLVAFETIY
jgi:hypothetical protein